MFEPPGRSGQEVVVGIDDMRVAVGESDGKVGVHLSAQMPLYEILVPPVVGIEEADERRVQSGEAAPDRPGLSDVRVEADIVEPRIVEARQAIADFLVGVVGRGIVDDDGALKAYLPFPSTGLGLEGDRTEYAAH
jgi:hypothetical protein